MKTVKTLLPALAATALLLAGCGSGDDTNDASTDGGAAPGIQADADPTSDAPAPTGTDAGTDEPAATEEPASDSTPDGAGTSLPDDLLPMDDPAFSANGEATTLANGASVTVDVDDIEITLDGVTSTGTLSGGAEGGVWQYPVEFAEAGTGYLVTQSGGEYSDLSVVFPRDNDIVVATEPEDVPFGYVGDEINGTTAETWTSGEGSALYTRVRVGEGESLSEDTYRLYTWEAVVEPDADGGGITLAPTDLGIVCFDDDAQTYEAC